MLYILVFVLLVTAQLAYFRLADHFNIIDKPNNRSSHTRITLRGGGIVFYMGVLFYFLLMSLLVFNFFNFRTKATCFAGDVGAISIAFVIVFMMCLRMNQNFWFKKLT